MIFLDDPDKNEHLNRLLARGRYEEDALECPLTLMIVVGLKISGIESTLKLKTRISNSMNKNEITDPIGEKNPSSRDMW